MSGCSSSCAVPGYCMYQSLVILMEEAVVIIIKFLEKSVITVHEILTSAVADVIK